ncbi:Hypothetical protein A7982_03868 [Minicystis rosea]|nr:Hypothetical protein A7982_03868 [Minicystis rosea]
MSPEAIAERRRKARENFGRVTPVPAGVQKTAGGPPAVDMPAAERTSGPSPWAQRTGFEIDKAALPSATMPARTSSPSDLEPTQDHKPAPPGAGSRRHTWIIVAVCTVVAVVGPLLMLMAGRMRAPVEQGGGSPPPAFGPSP